MTKKESMIQVVTATVSHKEQSKYLTQMDNCIVYKGVVIKT